MTTFPHLHLLVSGGNSQIIWVQNWQNWQIVGQTLDDAAGECLDKIGRMLGLDYPGGVWLARIAGLIEANNLQFPIGLANQFTKSSTFLHQNQKANLESELKLSKNEKISKTRPQNSFLQVPSQNLNFKKIIPANLNQTEPISKAKEKAFNISNLIVPQSELNLFEKELMPAALKSDWPAFEGNFQPNLANWNYSFSGLKTAVRYFLQKQTILNWTLEQKLTPLEVQILLNWSVLQDFMKSHHAKLSTGDTNSIVNKSTLENSSPVIDSLVVKWQALGLIKSPSELFQLIQNQDLNKLKIFYQVCVCAQTAVMTQLTGRLKIAIEQLKPASLGLSGGVSANLLLRSKMQELTQKYQLSKLYLPPLALTGDNAVMIGLAGLADLWSKENN